MTLVPMSSQLAASNGRTGKAQQARAPGGASLLDLTGHAGASIWMAYFHGQNVVATDRFQFDTPNLATSFQGRRLRLDGGALLSQTFTTAVLDWQFLDSVTDGFACGWLLGVQPNGESKDPIWMGIQVQEPDDQAAVWTAVRQSGAAADVGDTLRLDMDSGNVPADAVLRTEQGTI